MNPKSLRYALVYIAAVCSLWACNEKNLQQPASRPEHLTAAHVTTGENVPVSWYALELKLISESAGFTPPAAAHAIACTGIVLHEAVVHGGNGRPLQGLRYVPRPRHGKQYNWSIAANSAMACILRKLFPNASPANVALIDELESATMDALSNDCPQDEVLRSYYFGRQVAAAVYEWSAAAGGPGGSQGALNVENVLYSGAWQVETGDAAGNPAHPLIARYVSPLSRK
ncbi:hypothetical protein ACWKWU_20740 [Chitinophaga lutea]